MYDSFYPIRIFLTGLTLLLTTSALHAGVLDGTFQWQAGPALITPADPQVTSIKDPTVVFAGGRWHLYATIKRPGRETCMEYLSFTDWTRADAAPRQVIDLTGTYHCAPQVFYFTPQKKWYLIYQSTDTSKTPPYFGPAFSTIDDISKPGSLTKPVMLFPEKPANLKGWLDFWVICDQRHAYLFFTSLDGRFWRSRTALADFPHGWSKPELAYQGDIFEASHTYRLEGLNRYLTLIEAQGRSTRYYKAFLADRLDGAWKPLADTFDKPFASKSNVAFAPGVEPWSDAFSHGELLREGVDETMTVDPAHLRFLYQGCTARERSGKGYGQFQWRLGLLEAKDHPAPANAKSQDGSRSNMSNASNTTYSRMTTNAKGSRKTMSNVEGTFRTYKVAWRTAPLAIDADWDKPAWAAAETGVIGYYMGDKPAHLPQTSFRMMYDDQNLYFIFQVQDRYVRAFYTRDEGDVWKDSCVEFFFSPGKDPLAGYFNFETNCVGARWWHYHPVGGGEMQLAPADLRQVELAHSLDAANPEIQQPLTWTVEYRVPVEIIGNYMNASKPGPGVHWRGNFYKCADESSHPHFITWSRIDLPKPAFHKPEWFGTLEFQ